MKFYILSILMVVCAIFLQQCQSVPASENDITQAKEKAVNRVIQSIEYYSGSEQNPRTMEHGETQFVPSKDWTSGFYPGLLWYTYELTGNEQVKEAAHKHTLMVEDEKYNGTTHDMGFKIYCSFGNGYRLTGDTAYRNVLLKSAETLITRYNENVGCLRSWDHHAHLWQFPVIIDNMMNLELLMWAFKETNDSIYYNISVSHSDVTLANHFRDDYSTWHVINYDTITGEVLDRNTHQGFNDSSAWTRGQAWGLYGYTMMYRETGHERYLQQAKNIADFVYTHPTIPDDYIPYWDLNAPNIPDEPRDASAAAIICSALLELSTYVNESDSIKYMKFADNIFTSLSSPEYLAETDEHYFILDHSTGNWPKDSEIDVPIIYADYYYIESILRKLNE